MLINSILKASSIFKNKQYQQKLAGIAANSGICKNNNILKNVKPPINLTFPGGKINLDEKVINSITNKTLKDPYQQAYTGYIYSCVEALNSSNPKELVFLIDNKTGECIAKAAGDAVSCSFDKPTFKNTATLLHGHTPIDDSSTLPVSLQDFIVLNNNKKINQIIAFDKKGKKSFFKKTDAFKQLSAQEMKKLKHSYMEYLLNNSESKDQKHIKSLIQYCKSNPNSTGVKAEIVKSFNELQYKKYSGDIIDEFWKLKSPELNIEYGCEY